MNDSMESIRRRGRAYRSYLEEAVALWPTPTVRDMHTIAKVRRGKGSAQRARLLRRPQQSHEGRLHLRHDAGFRYAQGIRRGDE